METLHFTVRKIDMSPQSWWLRGSLLEAVDLRLIDPAATEIGQRPSNAVAHWGLHVWEGVHRDVLLDGLNGIVELRADTVGGCTRTVYVDSQATSDQRDALVEVLRGKSGGGFALLNAFVTREGETQDAAMDWREDERGLLLQAETTAPALTAAQARRRTALPGGSSVRMPVPSSHAARPITLSSRGPETLVSSVFWNGSSADSEAI